MTWKKPILMIFFFLRRIIHKNFSLYSIWVFAIIRQNICLKPLLESSGLYLTSYNYNVCSFWKQIYTYKQWSGTKISLFLYTKTYTLKQCPHIKPKISNPDFLADLTFDSLLHFWTFWTYGLDLRKVLTFELCMTLTFSHLVEKQQTQTSF